MFTLPALLLASFLGCGADDDGDGDGFTDGVDCNDSDPEVHPGSVDGCDGVDSDCDGAIDEDGLGGGVFFPDRDADGWGEAQGAVMSCTAPSGFAVQGGDCDDNDDGVFPGAEETCNSVDDDCDGTVDEPDAVDVKTWYADADADGFGDPAVSLTMCSAPPGWVADSTDCDGGDPTAHPGGTESCGGGDEDCDGTVDEDDAFDAPTWYVDSDTDGYGAPGAPRRACSAPGGTVADATDCDDANAAINPNGTEICGGADEDCDGTVDENDATDAMTWYRDLDGDGSGNSASSMRACAEPSGFVSGSGDCDDTLAYVFPGAQEVCDHVDDNCNGLVDEDAVDASTWYADLDQDGYGGLVLTAVACDVPSGYQASASDCDDLHLASYPGGTEVCDQHDNDCDGLVDEADATDAPEWYVDLDHDSYGDPTAITVACSAPPGHVRDASDCDDSDSAVHAAAIETCNGQDDDCDGAVDEDGVDAGLWFADLDGDGHGGVRLIEVACDAPEGFVGTDDDCDDFDAASYPGGMEICDTHDNDCDGSADEADANDAHTWYRDADDDRFGDPATSIVACTGPSGWSADAEDCDDTNARTNPSAWEVCDDADNDCDTVVDEPDALDSRTWYVDLDGDGFGNPSLGTESCEAPDGFVDDHGDCDDADDAINPGEGEYCDGIDEDCDGTVDDEAVDADPWYADSDEDGLGNPDDLIYACGQPAGYVADDSDCDDDLATLGIAELGAGDLVITEIMSNPMAVDDAYGEWFEIHNSSSSPVSLEGLQVSDLGVDAFTVTSCLSVGADGYVVLGVNGDTDLNGGVAVDWVYGSMSLADASDEILLSYGTTAFDAVAWDDATFPSTPGASMSLDGASLNAGLNNDGAVWCEGSSSVGAGDLGSPGSGNPSCEVVPTDSDGDGYATPADCDDSNADVHPGAMEECNGRDDDCSPLDCIGDEGAPHPWTNLGFGTHNDGNPDHFSFAVFGDMHTPSDYATDQIRLVVRAMNIRGPEFVMSVGDNIEGNFQEGNFNDLWPGRRWIDSPSPWLNHNEKVYATLDEARRLYDSEWDEVAEVMGALRMPFFYVPGNHDMEPQRAYVGVDPAPDQETIGREIWTERFGPTYYHFLYRGVLFLVANTEDRPADPTTYLDQGLDQSALCFSDDQIQYFRNVIANHPAEDVRWTFLFKHQFDSKMETTVCKHPTAIENLLEVDRLGEFTVFYGHNHLPASWDPIDNPYNLRNSYGGREIPSNKSQYPPEYAWVTMTDTGPLIQEVGVLLAEDFEDAQAESDISNLGWVRDVGGGVVVAESADPLLPELAHYVRAVDSGESIYHKHLVGDRTADLTNGEAYELSAIMSGPGGTGDTRTASVLPYENEEGGVYDWLWSGSWVGLSPAYLGLDRLQLELSSDGEQRLSPALPGFTGGTVLVREEISQADASLDWSTNGGLSWQSWVKDPAEIPIVQDAIRGVALRANHDGDTLAWDSIALELVEPDRECCTSWNRGTVDLPYRENPVLALEDFDALVPGTDLVDLDWHGIGDASLGMQVEEVADLGRYATCTTDSETIYYRDLSAPVFPSALAPGEYYELSASLSGPLNLGNDTEAFVWAYESAPDDASDWAQSGSFFGINTGHSADACWVELQSIYFGQGLVEVDCGATGGTLNVRERLYSDTTLLDWSADGGQNWEGPLQGSAAQGSIAGIALRANRGGSTLRWDSIQLRRMEDGFGP